VRRITSILILSFFIYNTIGFLAIQPLLLTYYKHLGRQRADRPSKEEMIERLIFSKEDILEGKIDFRWIDSREFKYNGDMYDIVKKDENDKQLIVYCINDTKEKKLEEEFEKRVHKNSSEDKHHPTTNNYNFVSLSEPVQLEKIGIALVYKTLFSYWWTDSYKSLNLDIHSPPPRLT
jgi:hypothetical protein